MPIRRTQALLLAGAIVAVIAVAATIEFGGRHQIAATAPTAAVPTTAAPSATAPASTSSPAMPTTHPGDVGGSYPNAVTIAGSSEPQPVLSVPEAIAARSSGRVGRELIVGGFYEMNPVPCAAYLDPSSELESCGVNFTWLLGAPEDLSNLNADGSGSVGPPAGPGINLVLAYVDWTAPPSDGLPRPVVITGHFDDRRADECPAGARLERCKRLFVVDAPVWTASGTIDVDAAPDAVGGLDVRAVANAIAVRDGGSSEEIAVAGWYNVPGAMSCPFIPASEIWWLEGYCEGAYMWLMASPELLITTSPDGMSMRQPTGAAIQPAFDSTTVRAPMGNGWPNVGSPIPVPAVFVGHFNDARSSQCTSDGTAAGGDPAAACRSRFVVDSIAWLNGSLREPGP